MRLKAIGRSIFWFYFKFEASNYSEYFLKFLFRTSQNIFFVSFTITNHLMLFREILFIYFFENRTKQKTNCVKNDQSAFLTSELLEYTATDVL
jgi:hypothetical protein